MRFALLTTVVAIGALACGKKGDQTQNQQQAAVHQLPSQRDLGGVRAGNRHVQHRGHRVRDQFRSRQ
jgi:hypothetical protein